MFMSSDICYSFLFILYSFRLLFARHCLLPGSRFIATCGSHFDWFCIYGFSIVFDAVRAACIFWRIFCHGCSCSFRCSCCSSSVVLATVAKITVFSTPSDLPVPNYTLSDSPFVCLTTHPFDLPSKNVTIRINHGEGATEPHAHRIKFALLSFVATRLTQTNDRFIKNLFMTHAECCMSRWTIRSSADRNVHLIAYGTFAGPIIPFYLLLNACSVADCMPGLHTVYNE